MIGYITKYALTQGIIKTKLEICEGTSTNMVEAPLLGSGAYFHGEGREWHRTRESAVKQVNEMKTKKLRSLRKAILALEAMTLDDEN